MRRPTHLIPGTANKKARCDDCDKKIKIGDNYKWGIVRVKGTLTRYRFCRRCA